MRKLMTTSLLCTLVAVSSSALAQTTVQCNSEDYQYTECRVGGALSRPQLIRQVSNSPCILNRTWGYNPGRGVLWVDAGCAGKFGDFGGYYHGRSGTYDEGARYYDHQGDDVGAIIGGLALGAILGAVSASDNDDSRRQRQIDSRRRATSRDGSGYDGCHGAGCLVDNPEDPNNWPLCSDGARHPDCSYAPDGY